MENSFFVRIWDREQDPETLLKHGSTQNKYALEMERNLKTGELAGYKEVSASNMVFIIHFILFKVNDLRYVASILQTGQRET